MRNSVNTKPNFSKIAYEFINCQSSSYNKEINLEILLDEIYKQGWEDGMSEGTEHAKQLRLHKEKYE